MMRLIFLFTFFVSVSLHGQSLKNFDWLIGDWHLDTGSKIIVESWKKVSANTFEGSSYSISKEKQDTTFSESLRLLEMSGAIFYLPYVSHNPRPIAFKLITVNQDSLIFENKDHDFPTRIIYIKKGVDNFTARVEGIRNKKQSMFELPYIRKKKN
ncbi:MAG: hypothetical protein D8M58_18130 [Calditrichaeota bacterium]|nr:MAG: hypothetical protein DWQ03_11360 [Calditrichota bacterium]MBL1207328.1 hypothetical protein [Calditrichota bacterium]NOG47161.1 hypothetical protein [Calditrichota bacterium]